MRQSKSNIQNVSIYDTSYRKGDDTHRNNNKRMKIRRQKLSSCEYNKLVTIITLLVLTITTICIGKNVPIVKANWIDPDTPQTAHTTKPLRMPPIQIPRSNNDDGGKCNDDDDDCVDDDDKSPTFSPSYTPSAEPSPTPSDAPTHIGEEAAPKVYHLVMSDEFNTPGRSFEDGNDPKWTALEKNDYTNDALHYYSADNAMTDENGDLIIKTEAKDTSFVGFNDVKGEREASKKHFKSAMIQTWNKFCFTGGIIEAEVQMPGKHNIGGLWPAFWLLGNIARHTYVGSTNHVWPWSSNVCTEKAREAQRINGCMNVEHFGLNAKVGRGAPEIDIFEVQPGPTGANKGVYLESPVGQPFASTSYQVAPGRTSRPGGGYWPGPGQWYDGLRGGDDSALNIFFYGDYNHILGDEDNKDYWSDSVSFNHQLDESHFNSKHKFRVEWELPAEEEVDGYKDEGYIRWFIDDKLSLEINGTGIVSSGEGASISTEPMYIIMNTAVSKQWGFPTKCPTNCPCEDYDCNSYKFGDTCGFSRGFCDMMKNESAPIDYKINYVRVYQNPNDPRQKVGCSTPERPTEQYVKAHEHLYKTENDLHPLKPIKAGGGSCTHGGDLAIKKEHCGGLKRGTCSASRQCVCKQGWVGSHCLSADGYDPIQYEVKDGLKDLEFTGFYLYFPGLAFILLVIGLTILIAPTMKRRMDGWRPIY